MSDLQENAQRLVDILEHMRKRPGMYFTQDRIAVQNFLNGLALGCTFSGIEIGHSERDKVNLEILQEHGLRFSAASVTDQLEEQGYSLEEIIDKTLIINIETVKRRYQLPVLPEKQD